MAQTQLSITGTPGRPYAGSEVKREAKPFTGLSVTATPGRLYQRFSAKEVKEAFTALSVMALPGPIHTFTDKAFGYPERNEQEEARYGSTKWGAQDRVRKGRQVGEFGESYFQLLREDEELMEIAAEIVASGILDK